MPKKPNEIIITTSIRIPLELKEKCEFLSKRDGLTFNEWVKRTLSMICDAFIVYHKIDKKKMISVFEGIDDYLEYDNKDPKIKTRADFIKKSSTMLCTSGYCPKCGSLVLADSPYCSECGEYLFWEHPYNKYFISYYKKYTKEHVLPGGWSYTMACPSYDNQNTGFSILKIQDSDPTHIVIVKNLNTDDLEDIKKEMDKAENDQISKSES